MIGFLIGLGFLNYPLSRMLGRPARSRAHTATRGYFRLSTDHKVVGIQYLWGIGLFFFIGGLNAMLIRIELLSPHCQVFPAGQYLTVVGLHGTMMIGIMSSAILGPFANYFVPIMIGARRMAFPRIEALTFWLLMAAGAILTTTIFFGGFPTGWTGYAPLLDQANGGDRLLHRLLRARRDLDVPARAEPDRHHRHHARARAHLVPAADLRVGRRLDGRPDGARLARADRRARDGRVLDRTAQTTFFIPSRGGSQYLYENLFWVFGHPEVYILAIPGFGDRARAAAGLRAQAALGLPPRGRRDARRRAALSFLVWQHHLFVSGINCDSRPFYMFSTELISVPTGFTFLCGLMTLWRGRIRLTVPMLFCLAWFFNFLIGGLSGVFLSDVPSDTTTHGSYFSMAHFHYTIMGGLVFAFFAAIYFWVPKMTGCTLNERLGKIHFWMMFIAFNSTFAPLFAIGFLGQSRRAVTYPISLQSLNDWVRLGVRAGDLDARVPLQPRLLARVRARARGVEPVGLPVDRVAAALAGPGERLRRHAGVHRRSVRLRDG